MFLPIVQQNGTSFLMALKYSLKLMLLHNGNIYRADTIGHSLHLLEEYNNIKTVISLLKYPVHNWIICVDLKMVTLLLGH